MSAEILELVWKFLNSPLGITLMSAIFLWVLNKVIAKRPGWLDYEGTIITGIRLAEKEIPNDTPNKSLLKLDAALNYALKVYEKSKKRRASIKEQEILKEGIQVVHDRLKKEKTIQ